MSATAAQVEKVESIAEQDGKFGHAPRPGWAIGEARRRQPEGRMDDHRLEQRYSLYYEAASSDPWEAADATVRRWRQAAR